MYHVYETTNPAGCVIGYAFLEQEPHMQVQKAKEPAERLRPGRRPVEVPAYVMIMTMELMAEHGLVNAYQLLDTRWVCDELPDSTKVSDIQEWVDRNAGPE